MAGQQSMIKLCSLLCRAHPPYLMTSAGMLSGQAALLSTRLRMAFSTLLKDGKSSNFGMIGSAGRSFRKPESCHGSCLASFVGTQPILRGS